MSNDPILVTGAAGGTAYGSTGRLVADQIMKRPTAIPFEPYLPSRKQEDHG